MTVSVWSEKKQEQAAVCCHHVRGSIPFLNIMMMNVLFHHWLPLSVYSWRLKELTREDRPVLMPSSHFTLILLFKDQTFNKCDQWHTQLCVLWSKRNPLGKFYNNNGAFSPFALQQLANSVDTDCHQVLAFSTTTLAGELNLLPPRS